jgi:hypothetical protein
MVFDPSSTIIALRKQQLSFDHVRLDGPVTEHRASRTGHARVAATGCRWRFELLRVRAA